MDTKWRIGLLIDCNMQLILHFIPTLLLGMFENIQNITHNLGKFIYKFPHMTYLTPETCQNSLSILFNKSFFHEGL